MEQFLTLDLESRADEAGIEAAVAAKQDELDAIAAPANYKDPEKIKRYVADKQAAVIETIRKEAALSPFTAYVSSIAWKVGDGRTQVVILVPYPGSDAALNEEYGKLNTPANVRMLPYANTLERREAESRLLSMFWGAFNACGGRTITFNGIGFDLPFLIKRSMSLRPAFGPMMPPNLRRYQTEPTRDLYAIITGGGGHVPGHGLKALVKQFGIPNLLPDLHGGAVADLYWWEEAAYNCNDTELTYALAQRMAGYYFPLDWAAQAEADERAEARIDAQALADQAVTAAEEYIPL